MSGGTRSGASKASQSSKPDKPRYFVGGREVTDEVVRTPLPGIEIHDDGRVVPTVPPGDEPE